MASAPSKLYSDDVSLVMVLLDTNPFFWSTSSISFSLFLSHALAFLNSILLLNQLNHVVVIATGYNSCGYVYDSSSAESQSSEGGSMPALYSNLLHKLEEFMIKDENLAKEENPGKIASALLSGSLSMALCYIQRVFRSGALNPQPRGSPDGPEQYVALMNAIFSAQRSMVPVDSCYVGTHNSAFLQQASYITGGVYVKPQHLDGLYQYLVTVFATDLYSRRFLQLPRPAGVDFRASMSIRALVLNPVQRWGLWRKILLFNIFGSGFGVFVIKQPLIWATYVLYVCPFFVSIIRNVQPADLYLVKLNLKAPKIQAIRERLQKYNLTLLAGDAKKERNKPN